MVADGIVGSRSAPGEARLLTGVLPALLLAIAIVVALGYPISRARHREIAERLVERRAARPP